jgi:hypothetical protein
MLKPWRRISPRKNILADGFTGYLSGCTGCVPGAVFAALLASNMRATAHSQPERVPTEVVE